MSIIFSDIDEPQPEWGNIGGNRHPIKTAKKKIMRHKRTSQQAEDTVGTGTIKNPRRNE